MIHAAVLGPDVALHGPRRASVSQTEILSFEAFRGLSSAPFARPLVKMRRRCESATSQESLWLARVFCLRIVSRKTLRADQPAETRIASEDTRISVRLRLTVVFDARGWTEMFSTT
jgi:hypothetical protein